MKCIGSFPEGRFSTTPHPFYTVVPAPSPPLPTQRLTGYMIFDAPQGVLVAPCQGNMNGFGWLQSLFLAIFFWPLMCVPCCLGCNYEGYQYPVYA